MRIGRRTFIAYMPGSLVLMASGLRQKEAGRTVAPDFALRTLDDKRIALSDFRDKVVVLDFWATWCEPCVDEIPNLNRFQERYGSRGLEVIGVVVESGSVKDIRRFVAKYDFQYQLLIGGDAVINKYKVTAFPTTLLIDPQGYIQKKYVGARSTKDQNIEREIQALLTVWGKED